MYATIRKYKTNAAAEVTRKVKEGFVPLIKKSKGFISYSAIETGKGEWASISVFETRAEEEASNQLAADWAKKSATGELADKPEITAGHVVIHQGK